MALTITDRLVRSAETAHTARASIDGWAVTWLPGRDLDPQPGRHGNGASPRQVGQIPADAGPRRTTAGSGRWPTVGPPSLA